MVWDFVVGRMIYMEALALNLPVRLSLLVTFMSGPPGLLLHIVIKTVFGLWRGRTSSDSLDKGE